MTDNEIEPIDIDEVIHDYNMVVDDYVRKMEQLEHCMETDKDVLRSNLATYFGIESRRIDIDRMQAHLLVRWLLDDHIQKLKELDYPIQIEPCKNYLTDNEEQCIRVSIRLEKREKENEKRIH